MGGRLERRVRRLLITLAFSQTLEERKRTDEIEAGSRVQSHTPLAQPLFI